MQTVFISHGGGPMPLLGDAQHNELVNSLQVLAKELARPKCIIVVSAHWESEVVEVTASSKPELLYDYYGFPEEAYRIQYSVPGHAELASQIVTSMNKAGLSAELNEDRGLDHGVFVPLKIMYPSADISVLQVSLNHHLAPEFHQQLGAHLKSVLPEDTLLVGSGFSFHNMKGFFDDSPESIRKNLEFEKALIALMSLDQDESDRTMALNQWATLPSAKYCHPREEHLIPLMVCYGANQRKVDRLFEFTVLNKRACHMVWV